MLKRLRETYDFEDEATREEWRERARVCALVGSCPKSWPSVRAGYRCYIEFATSILKMNGHELPPTVDALVAWSETFRCSETYSNYLGHVKLACELAGLSVVSFDHPSVRRAKMAVRKRMDFVPRQKMFVRLDVLQQLLKATADASAVVKRDVMMFLTSYVFLLRLPSECLPIQVAHKGVAVGAQAFVTVYPDRLQLHLRTRKNRPGGSVLTRRCWCCMCEWSCPVRVIGLWLESFAEGARPFGEHSASSALKSLRGALRVMGVDKSDVYRTHDLRRGHARDLQAKGASETAIRTEGQWRSRQGLNSYIDEEQLRDDAILAAHLQESSDSE